MSQANHTKTLDSQDVGLIFVREYYTFLNKKPSRLYAFYNKDSLFVRGDEGTIVTTAKGQDEIRKKIEECNFQDCKVLVTQVDSQNSSNDGILIQVLGQMCNRDGPAQKFSQTFFLATQPNGYYVLNDVFRFLKDEIDIDYYNCEDNQQVDEQKKEKGAEPPVVVKKGGEEENKKVAEEPSPAAAPNAEKVEKVEPKEKGDQVVVEQKVPEKKSELEPVARSEPAKVESKSEAKVESKNEPKAESKTEPKVEKSEPKEQQQKVDNKSEPKPESKEPEKPVEKAVEPVKEQPPATEEKKKKPESGKHRQSSSQQKNQQQQQQAPPVAEKVPSKPKSWAAIFSTDGPSAAPQPTTDKPNTTAASPVAAEKNISSPAATPAQAEQPQQQQQQTQSPQQQQAQQPSNQQQPQQQQQSQHQNKNQTTRKADATNIFVKLVNENISEEQLQEAFSKIGSIKSLSINRGKNCAFIEFTTPEACQKALAQHRVFIGNNHVLAEERRYHNNPNNRYNNNRPQNQHNNNQNMERRHTSNHRRGGATRGGNANSGKGRGTSTQK